MEKRRSFASIVAAVLLLLPVLCVGSYLALVKRTEVVVIISEGKVHSVTPQYRLMGHNAGWFFGPWKRSTSV